MENQPAGILVKNIQELPVSRSLVNFFELNNLHNLNELLKQPMEAWFSSAGFSQHLLNELMNYLESCSLVRLVKE